MKVRKNGRGKERRGRGGKERRERKADIISRKD